MYSIFFQVLQTDGHKGCLSPPFKTVTKLFGNVEFLTTRRRDHDGDVFLQVRSNFVCFMRT